MADNAAHSSSYAASPRNRSNPSPSRRSLRSNKSINDKNDAVEVEKYDLETKQDFQQVGDIF